MRATERKLSVLDLYAGLGGWSQAFLDRGHDVLRIDNDEKFADVPNTIIADVLEWNPNNPRQNVSEFDVVLASPPCNSFSLAATGTHMFAKTRCRDCGAVLTKQHELWLGCEHARPTKDVWLTPRTEFGKLSVRMVERALEIVRIVQPKWWWLENPSGGMKHFVPEDIPRVIVNYCQYDEGSRMKPTMLWGNWPTTWHPRPRCKNGDPCHESAPRGSKTGTQGVKGAAARALVPYQLSLEVCLAVEAAL